ncbi:hypothetical protein PYW08_004649 [Mythimna loreyi]|uniref:Uncharacterized protein n=1 Tax=Mythimna loreyi TaxID=667449 RepID=A0ACC2QPH9_9NEOP|nr:hypothetical protein PYW08_004649 [Mythimna loreyi]
MPGTTIILMKAALTSLEKEAKENVYAVLDPHIQYEITINKHGEPPKYLSLSKPLTHQRTHAFDPHSITNEINNNDYDRFSTFKTGPPKARRSNKSYDKNNKNYVSKTNNDVEYSKDPHFGQLRSTDSTNQNAQKYNEHKDTKNYSRMYDRNNSGRKENDRKNTNGFEKDFQNNKRSSYQSWKGTNEKERSFEDFTERNVKQDIEEDYRPRPGKVKEIASRFNKSSTGNVTLNTKKERPKPLQSYGNQAYLDHVFPDAVEI